MVKRDVYDEDLHSAKYPVFGKMTPALVEKYSKTSIFENSFNLKFVFINGLFPTSVPKMRQVYNCS